MHCSILHALLLSLLPALASAQTWSLVQTSGPTPEPRTNAGGVYDPATGRLLVFGGRVSGGERNDVWALDLKGRTWSEVKTSGRAPEPRSTHNIVLDPTGRRALLWSGRRGGTFFADVWSFGLESAAWTAHDPPQPRPNTRYGTAAVFDPVAGHLVNFAGFTDQGRFEDTWRFDPGAEAWTEIAIPANPGRRCLHAAAYDPLGHRMIIYGGQRSGPLGDIWALDLSTHTWTELAPADAPAGRSFAALAYDSRRHRLLVFGGDLQTGEKSGETWSFDLEKNRWQKLELSNGPPPRDGAVAAYVEEEDRFLVFGGAATSGLFNDVWVLAGFAPVEQTSVGRKSWGQVKKERR